MAKYKYRTLRVRSSSLIPKEHESTCVAALDYDVERQQVTVEFQERGTYTYFDVPPEVFAEFNNSGSRGTYFNLYFRNNYSYEKVA